MSPDVELDRRRSGFLGVQGNLATGIPGVFALGDVIGPPGLASAAMAQGRRLAEDLFGPGDSGTESPCPTVLWTLPEAASVGVTKEEAQADGRAVISARAGFREMPRGLLSGELNGWLELVVDSQDGVILGVHILGPGASELIHFGNQLIATRTTCTQLGRQVFAAVTLHELFRTAAARSAAALRDSGKAL